MACTSSSIWTQWLRTAMATACPTSPSAVSVSTSPARTRMATAWRTAATRCRWSRIAPPLHRVMAWPGPSCLRSSAEVLSRSWSVSHRLDVIMKGDPTGLAAHRMARTRFLLGDPAMFAGLATPFPLIVYSRTDIAALGRGDAPFYPAQVSNLFSSLDGRTHYVDWSAGWTGGSFLVFCETPADPCRVKEIRTWIT